MPPPSTAVKTFQTTLFLGAMVTTTSNCVIVLTSLGQGVTIRDRTTGSSSVSLCQVLLVPAYVRWQYLGVSGASVWLYLGSLSVPSDSATPQLSQKEPNFSKNITSYQQ